MASPIASASHPRSWLAGDVLWVLTVGALSRLWVLAMAGFFNWKLDLGRSPQMLMCSWDCGLYMSIVDKGYESQPAWGPAGDAASWAFFPLYPVVTRLFAEATAISHVAAAVVVSNLCFLAGLLVLHRHVCRVLDEPTARFVVLAFAISPLGLYFSSPYTESMYFLLMVSAMHSAHQGRWLAAGLLAAGLSATRNLGVFVVVPFLILGLSQFGWRRLATLAAGTERFFLALVMAPLGLFLFMLFLHHRVGDALAFKNVQVAWGGAPGNPLDTILQAWEWGSTYEFYGLACVGLALAASGVLLRSGHLAEALILLVGTLIPISVRLQSAPRYALTLYPVFLALGLLLRNSPRWRLLLLVAMVPPSAFMVASWVAEKPYTV